MGNSCGISTKQSWRKCCTHPHSSEANSLTCLIRRTLNATNTALSATATRTTASATSTFVAATPTYKPLSDCPASNDTDYTSQYASNSIVPPNVGLDFTKYCDLENPLGKTDGQNITQAFVYSFSDCVEVCAGYNFLNSGSNCTVAIYQPAAARPANCWVGNVGEIQPSTLNSTNGTNVAILQQ